MEVGVDSARGLAIPESGTFESEEALRHYFDVMDPLYSLAHDPVKARERRRRGIVSADAINEGFGGFLRTYDVTGPRLLTFTDAAAELSAAAGHPINYVEVSAADFVADAVAEGLPIELAGWIVTLCETVLDGRNEHLGYGVQEALGRAPRDFRDFAIRAAAEGAWATADTAGAR